MTRKIGRNDNCHCGSGLKYKKCCLYKEITNKAYIPKSASVDEKRIANTEKIADENGNGFYRIFWDDVVENVNPIEYYKEIELQNRAISYRDIVEIKSPTLLANLSEEFFVRFAEKKIIEENLY